MPTAREYRAALQLLTGAAVGTAQQLLERTTGSPKERRLMLLDGIPEIVGYYADGSAALASDFYEEQRQAAGVRAAFVPQLVVADRTVKIRRAIAWAAEPLFEGVENVTPGRLAEVVQIESARPFRDTITANRQRDPEAVGWRRVSAGGCNFCKMLAARGAVYRHDTARFAAHPHCHCVAEPVFGANDTGETASTLQYVASKRNRTPEQQAQLRDYLSTVYGAP